MSSSKLNIPDEMIDAVNNASVRAQGMSDDIIEEIEDLLYTNACPCELSAEQAQRNMKSANERLREAYRRGFGNCRQAQKGTR